MKKIEVQDTFKIAEKQLTNKLFLYGKNIIVTYTDISTFLPKETLLYKSLNDKSWKKELFPKLTYPSLSFNNGMLMGIAGGDRIFLSNSTTNPSYRKSVSINRCIPSLIPTTHSTKWSASGLPTAAPRATGTTGWGGWQPPRTASSGTPSTTTTPTIR